MSQKVAGDLLGREWAISERQYDILVESDVEVPVEDGGETLVGDVIRPDTDDPVPTIVGAHPYNNEFQSAPIKPKSMGSQLAWVESGDPYYFARRGYAHAILNVRGSGKSTG